MKYTFEIYNLNGYSRFISPLGDLQIQGKRENNEYFYRQELSTVKINKEDYKDLIKFENELNDFYITVKCKKEIIFEGIFNMQGASICKDKCEIELEIKEDSPYDCIERRAIDRNIIAQPSLSKVTSTYNVVNDGNFDIIGHDQYLSLTPIQQSAYGFISDAGPLLAPVAWARNIFTEPCINGTNVPLGGTLINDDCSDSGYFTYSLPYTGSIIPALNCSSGSPFVIDISATNPCTNDRSNIGTTTFGIGTPVTFNIWVDNTFGVIGATETLDRGYLLKDVLEYLIFETECGVNCFESDFLYDPINYVTGLDNELNHLMITEMGDITRATSSDPATVLEVNLFDLYSSLKEMFQLIYKIDENNCFRIEHVSRAIDTIININDLGDVIISPCCYSVDREEIPKKEKWIWNESNGQDFVGRDIEYRDSSGQFYSISEGDDEEHDVSDVSTDLNYLFDKYPDVDNLSGYVITANEFDGINYTVNIEQGVLSNLAQANGHLSQANLHNAYWRYDRYLINGELNGNFITFESVKPFKKNDTIKIKVCCDNFKKNQFDFSAFETTCGIGILEDYTYDLQTQVLELNIKLQ